MINWKDDIEHYFLSKYKNAKINDMKCFILPNGYIANVDSMPSDGENCIVMQYATSINAAKHYQFEDGDTFYPSDYKNVDEMISDIEKEVLS